MLLGGLPDADGPGAEWAVLRLLEGDELPLVERLEGQGPGGHVGLLEDVAWSNHYDTSTTARTSRPKPVAHPSINGQDTLSKRVSAQEPQL